MGDLLRGKNFTDGLPCSAADLHAMQDGLVIKDGAVTNVKLALMGGLTVKANLGAGTGPASDAAMGLLADALVLPHASIASAATVAIGAATSPNVEITGTTTITAFDTAASGIVRKLTFDASLILTHDGTKLILPYAVNVTTGPGDVATFQSLGSGNWKLTRYDSAGITAAPLPGRMQARLSLSSGVPVPTADITSSGSIYWNAYQGNYVTLFNGTWITRKIAAPVSASLSALGSFRLADVFGYDNAGTVALEVTPWKATQLTGTISAATAASQGVLTFSTTAGLSAGMQFGLSGIVGTMGTDSKAGLNNRVHRIVSISGSNVTIESPTTGLTYTSGGTFFIIDTARDTALDALDGIQVKGGDKTRVWLGMVMTWGTTGTSVDRSGGANQEGVRLLCNLYNAIARRLSQYDTTTLWSLSSNTFRPRNNSIVNSHYFLALSGNVSSHRVSTCVQTANNSTAAVGVGINTFLTPSEGEIVSAFTFFSPGSVITPVFASVRYSHSSDGFVAARSVEGISGASISVYNYANPLTTTLPNNAGISPLTSDILQ